jgi:predicted nucleic acid-binding protein
MGVYAACRRRLLGEVRYVYLREDKAGFEIARAAIESENNIRVLDITAPLAIHAAELRRRYYSKKNAFSYNDGLYLATGLAEQADMLITTDPHLLSIIELRLCALASTAKFRGKTMGRKSPS